MKKSSFSVVMVILFALASCSQANKSDNAAADNNNGVSKEEMANMEANNERVNRAIETGNFKGLDSLWTDDIVDHTGMMGREVKGKDSVMAELMNMSKTMKDMKIVTSSYAYDPTKKYFYALSNFSGTTTVAMDGMPANTKINMNSVDVLRIKDGKAAEHWSFNDPNEMLKMMAPPQKNK